MRIAMVCLGNICRSPMAEVVARALVAEAGLGEVEVGSFGTGGYHVGEGADPGAVAALRRHGWPPGSHRARQLTATDLAGADLVACADHANVAAVRSLATRSEVSGAADRVVLLRSFDPASGPGDDEVPDPYGAGPDGFDRSLDLIERACRGLVSQLVDGGR